MTLRIDPAVPRAWRTPHSVQFGIDEPLAVLEHVDSGHERLLDALTVGTGLEGLRAIAAQHGLTTRQVGEVTRALERVIVSDDDPPIAEPRTRRVSLVGASLTAAHLARMLESEGVAVTCVARVADLARTPTDLGIAVGHFVLSPELHTAWLNHDIPHLPVVLGDTRARIGPLIEPGLGPCLHCLERHRTDLDPAWPAIASQLLGRRSDLETPLLAAEIAAHTARVVLARLSGSPGTAIATMMDADGARSTQECHAHPECGCHSLAELIALPVGPRRGPARSARVRRGSATARARRAATTSTTTRATADEPA